MCPLMKCGFLGSLVFLLTLASVRGGETGSLRRQKREWFSPPRNILENKDYTTYSEIAKIRSDKENFTEIRYSIHGIGVDAPPVGIFSVDSKTGAVKIHKILDREEIPYYNIKGVAKYLNGSRAERDIILFVRVVDENDCAPVIAMNQVGFVAEGSAAGTVVMRVNASDADEKNTAHSAISFKIDQSSNAARMFYINSRTGEVMVQHNRLDRETQDTYKLTIVGSDLNGASGGNSGVGEIEIKLLDINDNIPTLERDSYEGSVRENLIGVEVMRIKAVDLDLMYTDNWLAVFEFISGNEGGYFSITTDAQTNEGVIKIIRALDYEEIKTVNLAVKVSNKAAYNFGSGSGAGGSSSSKSYPIKINVENEKEGPRFQPSVKVVTVSEGGGSISINKVITTYAAIDSDTLQIATNVRYAKLYDEDNWLSIDERTADIRLNKLPDRESTFLINGTYYAKIICITNDAPSRTATGTIAIQVEDFNDHCPQIISKTQTMCFEDNAIYVSAVDKDAFPNSAPFVFTVIHESTEQKWTVEPLNETAVILRDHAHLWPGIHKVAVEVKDQQGKACDAVETIDVMVCTCLKDSKTCVSRKTSSAVFGASGVLIMLLGLLLLLLVPLLLLVCLCGGAARDFKAIPFETKENLIQYSTEGQGEDKDVPFIPVDDVTLNTKDVDLYGKWGYNPGGEGAMGGAGNTSTLTAENKHFYSSQYRQSFHHDQTDYYGGVMSGHGMGSSHYRGGGGAFDGIALSEHFLGEYYFAKSKDASQQYQVNDQCLLYDYEGRESLAGSVGCCSNLGADDDLTFLDDLGPKFKTLAEICRGSSLVTESVAAGATTAPVRPPSPVRPPASSHTHVHTHTEAGKDHTHSSSFTSATTSSSTVVQKELVAGRGHSSSQQLHLQDNIVLPNQTLLIQQPAMYYAATPMYVVETKPQMVLVTGAAQQAVGQVSHVGLGQGVVQVGGIQGSQGLVLVEGQVAAGGAAGGVAGRAGQSHPQGSVSRSQHVLLVENGSSSSSAGGARSAQTAQGLVQTGRRSAQAGSELGSVGVQERFFSSGSAASSGDSSPSAPLKVQGRQKVVVQHKKISVTERNIESSSRA